MLYSKFSTVADSCLDDASLVPLKSISTIPYTPSTAVDLILSLNLAMIPIPVL
jgi:hypothetical protein